MRRVAGAMVLGALLAACLGACGGEPEGCAVRRGAVRAAVVPAGQTWLVGVRGGARRSSVYVMTSRGLLESRTGGRSWRRLGPGGRFLGFDASGPEHLLGTTEDGQAIVSFDAGHVWRRVALPACVAGLDGAVFSRSRGLLYGWMGGPLTEGDPHKAAVVVSRDGGRSFEKVASYETNALAVASDPRVVYVTTAEGLFVSRTAGAEWSHAALPGDLHAIAVAPRTVFVAAYTGRFVESREGEGGTTQRLYRSLDAGEHATSVQELFDIASVAVAPGRPATVYVAGERIVDNRAKLVVLRSDDGGRHWQTRSSAASGGPPTIDDMARPGSPNDGSVVVDPADREILYRDTGTGVERSSDGGRSFHALRVEPG